MKRGILKEIYLSKFSRVSGFKVWIVNGKYVRDNLDIEFTNYGNNSQFKFIPADEFWIDKERNPGEEEYFIKSMLVMNRLLSKGIKSKDAVKIVNRIEKMERSKSKLISHEIKSRKGKKDSIKKIHKELIKEYSVGKIKVWIVNGELVRGIFFLDFTEGGHDKVYKFIPRNQIWIDDDLDYSEIRFVLLHEIHERNLMARGMRYNDAHKLSSELEYYCRNHPRHVNKYLKKEFKKAEKL